MDLELSQIKILKSTVRDVRKALIDADVNFKVVKSFVSKIEKEAEGTKVIKSVKPGEHFIKIIHDEMISLLGKKSSEISLMRRALLYFLQVFKVQVKQQQLGN